VPTNRKFVRRHLRRELTWEEEMELWLGPSHRGSLFASREDLQQAWLANRDRLMAVWGKHGRRPACPCRKLDPHILMMQSAQDGAAEYAPHGLGSAWDRRILVQG
jgi:hypothetical protein